MTKNDSDNAKFKNSSSERKKNAQNMNKIPNTPTDRQKYDDEEINYQFDEI